MLPKVSRMLFNSIDAQYYKVVSAHILDDKIYVMDNPASATHIEIRAYKTHKHNNEMYQILDTLHDYSQPFLFRNMYGLNGIEHYQKVSSAEFLSIYDAAFAQHRKNII